MITIVDYGVGNIASLVNMLDFLGFEARATGDPAQITSAAKLILPGIGAFDHAMRVLAERGLVDPLRHSAGARGAPLLGVCLGMQLLTRGSDEGVLPGLGLIAADVKRIAAPAGSGLKVPNTGWRDIAWSRSSALFPRGERERFYHVHSYHAVCDDPHDCAATIDYGGPLTVAVSRGNVHGVQFHPEKSHRHGMRLLRTFARL